MLRAISSSAQDPVLPRICEYRTHHHAHFSPRQQTGLSAERVSSGHILFSIVYSPPYYIVENVGIVDIVGVYRP